MKWLLLAVIALGDLFTAVDYSSAQSTYTPYVFTTLAGTPADADGTGSAARFNGPGGVAVDTNGNIYVADQLNDTVRKITPMGTNWLVTTLAGLGEASGTNDGTGSAARFYGPSSVAVDSSGNVYVVDTFSDTIRKVTPAGVVTTLAGLAGVAGTNDGTGSAAQFNQPYGVAVDTAGNVYVADTFNYTVRKVTPMGTNWVVTTLAGLAGVPGTNDGTGSDALFNITAAVVVDTNGNVYVADYGNDTIRKITPMGTNWVVTTLAGLAGVPGTNDGTGSAARFNQPDGVAVDTNGNVYVPDGFNNTIRKVTPMGANWVVTTPAGLAGTAGSADGTNSAARFNLPWGVAVDSAGNVYVGEENNSTIRKVTPMGPNWAVTTLAGEAPYPANQNGTGSAAWFYYPFGLAVDTNGNAYVADADDSTVRQVTPAGVVTTLAGSAGSPGSTNGTGNAAQFWNPSGVAVDSAGNVYVADTGNNTIREITPMGTNWVVTTLAGSAGSPGSTDGQCSDAQFWNPSGVAVDSAGNVYVADTSNDTIREITPTGTNCVVTTLAGLDGFSGTNDGPGSVARFNSPSGVAVDSAGNVYVADSGNNTIREVTPMGTNWVVTTLAGLAGTAGSADGAGNAAQFNQPNGVAVDRAGNVYVADSGNSTIRKVTPAGAVTTLAGLAGTPGSANGTGSAARFSGPNPYFGAAGLSGVAVDGAGNVYVADTGNSTIRKGYPASMILTSAPGFGFRGAKFSFDLTGPPAQLIIVDASSNLLSWLPIWTNTLETNALSFSDPQSGFYPQRFYRARLP